jgi:hypothetical protein
MPALPGAQKIFSACGDCASFQTSACSRPPEPMTRIFMKKLSADYADGRRLKTKKINLRKSAKSAD